MGCQGVPCSKGFRFDELAIQIPLTVCQRKDEFLCDLQDALGNGHSTWINQDGYLRGMGIAPGSTKMDQGLGTAPGSTTMALRYGPYEEQPLVLFQLISSTILEGLGTAPGSTTLVPRYGPCEEESLKERMMRAVAMLGEAEVADIQAQEGKIEVTCEFCQTQMQFSEESIMQKIKEMRGAPDEVSPEDVKRMA
eukprot:1147865-Pelagomonas_calceolata.AAC.11